MNACLWCCYVPELLGEYVSVRLHIPFVFAFMCVCGVMFDVCVFCQCPYVWFVVWWCCVFCLSLILMYLCFIFMMGCSYN